MFKTGLNWIFAYFVLSLMILLWFLMILLWYLFLLFARSLISYKYLYINDITYYFRLQMRLWDFFLKKYIRVRKRGLFLFCIIIGLWQHHSVMDVWHALLIDNPWLQKRWPRILRGHLFFIYSAPWWFSPVCQAGGQLIQCSARSSP